MEGVLGPQKSREVLFCFHGHVNLYGGKFWLFE